MLIGEMAVFPEEKNVHFDCRGGDSNLVIFFFCANKGFPERVLRFNAFLHRSGPIFGDIKI